MRGRHDADEMIEEAAASQEMFLRRQGLAQSQGQGLGLSNGQGQGQGLGQGLGQRQGKGLGHDRGDKQMNPTDSNDRRHHRSYDTTRTSSSNGPLLSSNQPQPLDKEKLGLLKRAFDRYDVDGDGAISVDDLQLAFLAQGRTQGME